jgi:hypothetical protein
MRKYLRRGLFEGAALELGLAVSVQRRVSVGLKFELSRIKFDVLKAGSKTSEPRGDVGFTRVNAAASTR